MATIRGLQTDDGRAKALILGFQVFHRALELTQALVPRGETLVAIDQSLVDESEAALQRRNPPPGAWRAQKGRHQRANLTEHGGPAALSSKLHQNSQ